MTLGKIAAAYGLSRSAFDRMRFNFEMSREDLLSPPRVFYKLCNGRSTELRTRLLDKDERDKIRALLQS
jgi:hypothetical protein